MQPLRSGPSPSLSANLGTPAGPFRESSTPRELPVPEPHIQTLVEVARRRAEQAPDKISYIFLTDGELQQETITYRELDRRARAIAVQLRLRLQPGDRALLMFDPGIEYITAFFGCLYAGVIAVPMYPPEPARMHVTLPRLQAVVRSAAAKVALGSKRILDWAAGPLAAHLGIEAFSIASLPEGCENDWQELPNDGETIAFLQYTSGSTDIPKGVVLSHANLLHNLRAIDPIIYPGFTGCMWLPPYHDMGLIGGILAPLFTGRQNVLMSPVSFMQKPMRWLQGISRHRAHTSGAPNFGYEVCIRKLQSADAARELEGVDLSCWKLSFNGAEQVRADTLDRFAEAFAPYGFRKETFLPCYGLAESTLIATGGTLSALPVVRRFSRTALEQDRVTPLVAEDSAAPQNSQVLVGCGAPVTGMELAIVDPETGRRLPPDCIGEIYLRGGSVAQGYWNRGDESRRTFDAHIRDESGPGYLRTGDLGFLHEGELFITGRRKELIILFGRNYYPHDIEHTVQRAHESLKADGGAAFSIEVANEERLVIVQEVLKPRKYDLQQVIQAVRQQLLSERDLSPHAILLIPAGTLPKTTSGKTQRRECRERYLRGDLTPLAEWSSGTPGGGVNAAALENPPQTEMEHQIAEIWSESLGVYPIGRTDDFFQLGGQSLRAFSMLGKLSDEFQIEVPIATLFARSTLAEFASLIEQILDERSKGGAGPTSGFGVLESGIIPPVDRSEETLPASYPQQRLWIFEQFERGGAAAHVPIVIRLRGDVDAESLAQAIERVAAAREILRTTFVDCDGSPRQKIHASLPVTLERRSLLNLPPKQREAEFARQCGELAAASFSLSEGPLWRATLFDIGPGEHALHFVFHHSICDGRSAEVFLDELASVANSLLRGEAPSLPTPRIQYADFAASQVATLTGSHLESRLAWWKNELAGFRQTLELPELRFSGDSSIPNAAATATRGFPAGLWKKLEAASRRHRVTPFMILLGAFEVLLERYSGCRDFCVGAPAANRKGPELENMLGCFVNVLPLRSDLADDPTVPVFLDRVRRRSLEAFAQADAPFERIVEQTVTERRPGRMPLVDALFVYQTPQLPPRELAGGALVDVEVDYSGLAAFQLALVVEPGVQGQKGTLVSPAARIEPNMLERMLDALFAAAGALSEEDASAAGSELRISQLAAMSPQERHEVLEGANATALPFDDRPVHELIASRCRENSQAEAVEFAGRTWTRGELERRSVAVAARLAEAGLRTGEFAAVLLDRSPELVASLLGILRAGGAYLPLDPGLPLQRLQFLAADSQINVVATQRRHAELARSLAGESAKIVLVDEEVTEEEGTAAGSFPSVTPEAAAYLLYTSGSTGQPKGTVIRHRSLASLIAWYRAGMGLGADHTFLATTTISFDIAFSELLMPLAIGAKVSLAHPDSLLDAFLWSREIERTRANVLQATPSSWRMLLGTGWRPKPGMIVICGGEALPPVLASQLASPGSVLWNVYGPTETTVWSSARRIEAGEDPVLIGRPLGNTSIYILDDHGFPAPVGVPGEIFIGGIGIAREYWRRPELTAERFVPDPYTPPSLSQWGGRNIAYRTGDRGRRWPNGELECLGRLDQQIKIRGFRIELGEIEAALAEIEEVLEAAVVCRENLAGEPSLVGYVALRDGVKNDHCHLGGEIAKKLAVRLPAYMIPERWVFLASMPHTPNGKVDRRALPAPTDRVDGEEGAAPSGPVEETLQKLWEETLGISAPGVRSNFFELGGNSLLAMRLASRMKDAWDVEIAIRRLFEKPTIEAMAECVQEAVLERVERMSEEEASLWLARFTGSPTNP